MRSPAEVLAAEIERQEKRLTRAYGELRFQEHVAGARRAEVLELEAGLTELRVALDSLAAG